MDPSEPQTDPLSGLGTAPDDGDPDAGPQSYLRRLKVALLNEKACPDILFYKTELVTRLREQMDDQERTISDMDASGPGSELARMAYAYEGARARYVLKAYLRTRLLKIEKYMTHVLDVAEVQERLSPEEMSFASEYFATIHFHLKKTVLSKLPKEYASLVKESDDSVEKDMIPNPPLLKRVLARAVCDCGELNIEGTTIPLEDGDTFIMPYNWVEGLVHDDKVQLL